MLSHAQRIRQTEYEASEQCRAQGHIVDDEIICLMKQSTKLSKIFPRRLAACVNPQIWNLYTHATAWQRVLKLKADILNTRLINRPSQCRC